MIPAAMLLWLATIIVFAPWCTAQTDWNLLARCEAAGDCCACVSTPGCSWLHGAKDARIYPARCAPTSQAAGPGEEKTPDRLWKTFATFKKFNKSINIAKRRLIRPQRVTLKQNVGIRQEFEFEVMSKTNIISFRVTDGESAGGFNWTVVPAAPELCREFNSQWTDTTFIPKKSKKARYVKHLIVTCNTGEPKKMGRFKMMMDTPTCAHRAKNIRAILLPMGVSRDRMKVKVVVKCQCPCYSQPDKNNKPLLYQTEVDPRNGTRLFMQRKKHLCEDPCTFPAYKDVSRCHNDMCTWTPYGSVCSGHGTCRCGECLCDPGHTGMLCECDSRHCPVSDGQVCGGPSRGTCVCGKCQCRGMHGGAACELNTQNIDGCVEHPHDIETCSGRGVCTQGQCVCPAMYSGKFCEAVDQCPLHRHCARCFLTSPGVEGGKPFIGGTDAFSSADPRCRNCQHDPSTRYTLRPPHVAAGHRRHTVNHGCTYQDERGCWWCYTYVQASHVYGHETTIHVNQTVVCE